MIQRGESTSTQFNYLRAVRKYSDYFIYLKNVKKFSRSASTQAMCGLKFFYTYTIEKQWPTFKDVNEWGERASPLAA